MSLHNHNGISVTEQFYRNQKSLLSEDDIIELERKLILKYEKSLIEIQENKDPRREPC